MTFRWSAIAIDELRDAYDHYTQTSPELARHFSKQVAAALDRIRRNPEAWSLVSKNARRCMLKHFPYGVVYHRHGDSILILAVRHLHRRPRRWDEARS
jgi:plasmid stabilization system protein ParE